MCGITGIIDFSKLGLFNNDRDIIKDHLIYNSVRGSHSTGLFGGDWKHTPDYIKSVGNPYDLLDNVRSKKFFENIVIKYKFVIGHGRHATRGQITSENAHPFQVGHITMVHNGTVSKSDLVNTHKHSVDSLAITHALSDYAKEDVVADIDGAFALAWYDNKTEEINIVRNEERPLCLLLTDKDQFIISSESYFGHLAASRRGTKITKSIIIPPYRIFTFSQKMGFDYTETEVKKKEKKTFFPYQYPQKFDNKPKAKLTGLVGKEGKSISVGQRVDFEIDNIFEAGRKSDGTLVWQVFGTVPGIDTVEVNFVYFGNENDLLTSNMWRGTVRNIKESSANKQYIAYLGDVSKIFEEVAA